MSNAHDPSSLWEETAILFADSSEPKAILDRRPSQPLVEGSHELLELSRKNRLDEETKRKLDQFEQAERLMRLIKTRIRKNQNDGSPTAMNQSQPNNPLHGVTLKAILEYLVAEYGWERLGQRINIHCFNDKPSINSSLKFLRKTDWARAKVERLYLNSISYDERKSKNKSNAGDKPSDVGNVWDRARRDG